MLSWNAKLGQVIGTIVFELCRSIFGELQFDRTVQTIIAEIQCQFEQIPTDIDLNPSTTRSFWIFQFRPALSDDRCSHLCSEPLHL